MFIRDYCNGDWWVMATVADAIIALIPDEEWVLRGEPTTEDEFTSMFRRVIGENENGTAIESDNPDNWGITWSQIETKRAELEAAEPLAKLREERNRRLAETDWWTLYDHQPTPQDRLDYRQALRDITDTYQSLDTVVWPEKPE
jgi:phenylpyruvate tautomerase PptA (4-oxalocrotonate tautomerase family)